MTRQLFGIAAGAVLGLAAGSAGAADLTVTSWGGSYQDAQRQVYFEPFKQATGIDLVEDVWNGGVGAIRAKVEGGGQEWDVVQVEAEELVLGCEEGLYAPIDWQAVGGKDQFIDAAVNDCGVGTIVWSTAIAYDGDKLKDGPKSWADFFDTQKFPGKRGLRRGPKYTLEFALMADGVPADKVYDVLSTPEGVDRAFAKLDTIKKDIVWWEAGAQPPELLADGEVAMTTAYNGRLYNAIFQENKPFVIVWDGQVWDLDLWGIPKGSDGGEKAWDFIKFSTDTQRLADQAKYISYGPARKSSMALVNEEVKPHLPTAPENFQNALQNDYEWWADNQDEMNERFNAWLAK